MSDAAFMQRALAVAERGRGLTSPNPLVGAVIVRDGRVVGEGAHLRAGGPHAEVAALQAAAEAARGAILYVTLEPCAHHGRTPPCAPAVAAAGIARVVVAMPDPNPLVVGGGADLLRAAGITVEVGVMAAEAERLNRAWLTAMRERRPHVTLKAATTLDGKLADLNGTSQWITGAAARRRAHELRAQSDAILVGATTARRDDPSLTVRLDQPWPREPYRVVLDSRARLDPHAKLIHAATPSRALVMVGAEAPADRIDALAATGATIVRCRTQGVRLDPAAVLDELFRREVRAVLIEGGGEVHGAFVDAGLVDRVAVFVAPLLIGGRDATITVGGVGRELKNALRLGAFDVTRLGDDLLLEADVLRA
ncbi:MAG TPA: bifunctional diaminohydroxyphosphoribosylaminopyrimidine deaminase/5-amino-6-(5-phosphoribosylamino)uracil reductase RibD [Methylomirabilota bacterium]|jgi:diaminohydroxyphosphoribosylaminopyrimidine deaminase/5-amino-6-(5-phosphoribosylamino)uracil reductase|nr:bifunctional diaminohydroxyphosphoribosylaminopyrimidine deaminase/5-amino-6-(5-phosphoribosylamino)uracil reductase RibD [Methylomirabilota bacterium]